jgi:hypothetical protein
MHDSSAESGVDSDLGCGRRLVALLGDEVDQRLEQTPAGRRVLFGACPRLWSGAADFTASV